jgi:polar amino acid transport system substrate-binding protein
MFGRRLFAAAALAAALLPRAGASAEELRAIITEEWPPYNYAVGGTIAGYSVEVVRALMKRLGIDLPIELLPGARAKDTLDKGGGIVFFLMFRTPEREGAYKWIGAIDEASFHFYKKKGSPLEVHSLDEARNAAGIACRNYGLVFNYLKGEGFANLDTSPNADGIYRKVLDGRCELAIGETPLGVRYILKEMGLPADALAPVELGILDANLYVVGSKDLSDAEVARWRAALEAMKASGELRRIYAEHMR